MNTPDGVVDLTSGAIRPHKPDDYCTMISATSPGGNCPRWRKFLDEVTGNDADLAGFLQRLAGYSLTGSTREHSLAFLYGVGANCKSVFLGTLAGVLGDQLPRR